MEVSFNFADLVAIKFLKRDTASEGVTRNAIFRFCQEAQEAARAIKSDLGDVVANMSGYGRFSPLPSSLSPDLHTMEEAFGYSFGEPKPNGDHILFYNKTTPDLNNLFAPNSTSAAAAGMDIKQFTGDFYVLELCLLSLEELLLTRGDPYAQSAYSAVNSVNVSTTAILDSRPNDSALLESIGLSLDSGATGFHDLNKIDEWFASAVGGNSKGHFRNAALFQIWSCASERVQLMHKTWPLSEQEVQRRFPKKPKDHGRRGIAHRDLKPANMLLQTKLDFDLRLCDLGFVASVGEIAAGNRTLVNSVDEGGVLPAGSKGFRAPEQIESGEGLAFEPLKAGSTSVTLYSDLDIEVNHGDWIRVSGSFVDDSSLTRITSVTKTGDTLTCTLASAFKSPEGVSKGRIIKDVSLHSDVYALGCLAYYLGSEGRSPERFMRQYVDDIVLQAQTTTLPQWVLESPFWLAAIYCRDAAVTINSDLLQLKNNLKSDEKELLDGNNQFESHLLTIQDSLGRATLFAKGDQRKIQKFWQSIERSAYLRNNLTGRVSNRPIPFPLLLVTMLCCLRDKKGSIVKRDPPAAKNPLSTSVYSGSASDFAATIFSIAARLREANSLQGKWNVLGQLGKSPADIFMRIRMAGFRK